MMVSLHKISDGSIVLLDTQVIRSVETVNKETYVTCTDKVYKVIESVETIHHLLKPKPIFITVTDHSGHKQTINSALCWLVTPDGAGSRLFLKTNTWIDAVEPYETVLEMLN